MRGGIGAVAGLIIAGLFVMSPAVDSQLGLYLIAPFGASSVLLFAVRTVRWRSPGPPSWAIRWRRLIGVAVCLHSPIPRRRIAVAVGLAITATIRAARCTPLPGPSP